MSDTLNIYGADYKPVYMNNTITSVYGKNAMLMYPSINYNKADLILRSNRIDITFTSVLSWTLLFSLILYLNLSQSKKIWACILYFFNFKKYNNQQYYLKWFDILFYVLFFLFSLSLFITNICKQIQIEITPIIICLLSIIALLMYFVFKYCICQLIQICTNQSLFVYNLSYVTIYTLFAMSILIILLFCIQTFVLLPFQDVFMQIQIWIVGAFVIFYIIKTLMLFLYNHISFILWLIYFCTIEIIPILLIYKFITNLKV